MRIDYARKFSFFIRWLLYVQLLREKNRCGLVWAVGINLPELPIKMTKLKTKQILQAQVHKHKLAQKKKQVTKDAS